MPLPPLGSSRHTGHIQWPVGSEADKDQTFISHEDEAGVEKAAVMQP